jgi:branched-chain amino acid transport system permease protein
MNGNNQDNQELVKARHNVFDTFVDSVYSVMKIKKIKYSVLGVITTLAFVLPFFANNYVVEVGSLALMYIVLCLGLNITIGYAGLFNLGYAAFFAFGAYTSGILVKMGINFWLTIPVTILISVVVAVIIGGPSLKLRSDYLGIVTLGFGEITRMLARNLDITGGPSGLVGIPRPSIFGFRIYDVSHFYWTFYVLAIISVIITVNLHHSRFGRALKCIRDDEDAASAMGIYTLKYKLLAFIVGAIFAGIAGSFFAVKMASVSPESFTFTQSTNLLMAIILGGVGKIPGVIIGAIIVIVFPEIFRSSGSMRMLFFGIVLVVLMIFRPQGLWPEKR